MAYTTWDNITVYGLNPEDDQYSFDYNMNSTSPLKTTLPSGSLNASIPTTISVAGAGTITAAGAGGGGGGTGSILSTSINSNITWTNNITATAAPYTISAGDTYTYANAWGVNKTLKVDGDAEFNGDIKVNGVSLTDRLDEIEKRLAILRPNNDLEGKWEKLKKLGEEYRAMEKEILEQEKIWDILKK